VPDLIVKHVATQRPELFRDVYNRCLRDGVFPAVWKRAKLILLRMGNKPPDQASSYRPICLLNTQEKLFERIIKGRLEAHLLQVGNLNDRQFGSRKGRSKVNAVQKVMGVANAVATNKQLCALVALDVANAFNSAR